MSPTSMPPAGWYDDLETGGLRWWDGERWTEHRSPSASPPEFLAHDQGSPGAGFNVPSVGIAPANRKPTLIDAWNGLVAGGRWITIAVLMFVFVGLAIMLGATIGGASSATAAAVAGKVIVYGGLGLIALRFLRR